MEAGYRERERGEGLRWAAMAVCQDTLMCRAVLFQQLLGGEGKLFTVGFHPACVCVKECGVSLDCSGSFGVFFCTTYS